jgi:hypothetical protein
MNPASQLILFGQRLAMADKSVDSNVATLLRYYSPHVQRILILILSLVGLLTSNVDAAAQTPTESASAARFFTTREEAKQLPLPKEDAVFQFAIFGDRTGGVPEGLQVLEQAVIDTNLMDPDLVMTVGDLVQGYNQTPQWLAQKDEFQAIMNRLEMDWFPVAGNHDVYWQRQDPNKPLGQHEKNYEQHFGPLWYSFQHKNAGFLVLFSDEGNPETNEKGFNDPQLQMMSPRQLDFVKQALEQLKEQKHVFVFLHHPRWIGGNYEGSNWEQVHETLVAAGNVSAVFAGHIHRMRYDGKRDGIEYYALATTGGNLSVDFPAAGFLHHFNVVTVHEDRFQVATIPVGGVIDPKTFTQDYLRELETLRNLTPRTVQSLGLTPDGRVSGVLELAIDNPLPHPIDVSLTANISPDWQVSPDHQHTVVEAGKTQTMSFRFLREIPLESGVPVPDPWSNFQLPTLGLEADLIKEDTRLRVPGREFTASMTLGEVPEDFFSAASDRAFSFQKNESVELAGIRIEHTAYQLPQGPFTLEAWVKSTSNEGSQGIVAKTQSSEYALFAHQGRPSFDVHLSGSYVTARANTELPLNQWVHVAGVFDGQQVALFVDGQPVATNPGSGVRTENQLPLWIAADPDGKGVATRPFLGLVDDVRLSTGVRYAAPFQPTKQHTPDPETVLLFHMDQTIGPFWVDHGPRGVLGRGLRRQGDWVERN